MCCGLELGKMDVRYVRHIWNTTHLKWTRISVGEANIRSSLWSVTIFVLKERCFCVGISIQLCHCDGATFRHAQGWAPFQPQSPVFPPPSLLFNCTLLRFNWHSHCLTLSVALHRSLGHLAASALAGQTPSPLINSLIPGKRSQSRAERRQLPRQLTDDRNPAEGRVWRTKKRTEG